MASSRPIQSRLARSRASSPVPAPFPRRRAPTERAAEAALSYRVSKGAPHVVGLRLTRSGPGWFEHGRVNRFTEPAWAGQRREDYHIAYSIRGMTPQADLFMFT